MSVVLSQLPMCDYSQYLQGSDISTQAAISAGEYSYPIDALGAYIISVVPQLVCEPEHWKKSSSVIQAPVLSTSPFTSRFLQQLAFRRALSGSLTAPLRSTGSSACTPPGQGLKEFTSAMQAGVSQAVRV